jgi:hypothetical protein
MFTANGFPRALTLSFLLGALAGVCEAADVAATDPLARGRLIAPPVGSLGNARLRRASRSVICLLRYRPRVRGRRVPRFLRRP